MRRGDDDYRKRGKAQADFSKQELVRLEQMQDEAESRQKEFEDVKLQQLTKSLFRQRIENAELEEVLEFERMRFKDVCKRKESSKLASLQETLAEERDRYAQLRLAYHRLFLYETADLVEERYQKNKVRVVCFPSDKIRMRPVLKELLEKTTKKE
jgi:hypothetical protein